MTPGDEGARLDGGQVAPSGDRDSSPRIPASVAAIRNRLGETLASRAEPKGFAPDVISQSRPTVGYYAGHEVVKGLITL